MPDICCLDVLCNTTFYIVVLCDLAVNWILNVSESLRVGRNCLLNSVDSVRNTVFDSLLGVNLNLEVLNDRFLMYIDEISEGRQ